MRAFIDYFVAWLHNSSLPALLITLFFVSSLVAVNYTIGIEWRIQSLPWYLALPSFFCFFSAVLTLVWGLQYEWGRFPMLQPRLILLLALSALFFSLKMVHWDLLSLLPRSFGYPWNRYILLVLQLPLKLILLFFFLHFCWRTGLTEGDSLAGSVGLTLRGFKPAPYFGLLLLLVPLIVLASTQHDFLVVYPKVQNLAFIDGYARPSWPWKVLYEISYGLDFLGIELFFRGLLVIGLLGYAGTKASSGLLRHGPHRSQPSPGSVVLPMAAFYCTIHFGKPMGECISSFFGGLVLGVLAARTRTIYGGLIIHLGLAWLMELGGWLGHLWTH
jgi:hypothetical protein